MEIQHGVGIEDFVFQVGSEEKVNWMWADKVRSNFGYFRNVVMFCSLTQA